MRGGKRPGAGRPSGRQDGSKRALHVETVKQAHAALSSGLSPVDVMLGVMRGDDTITERQYRAAVDVAPFVCPRLSAVAVADVTPKLTPEQIDRRLAELLAKVGPPVIDASCDVQSCDTPSDYASFRHSEPLRTLSGPLRSDYDR